MAEANQSLNTMSQTKSVIGWLVLYKLRLWPVKLRNRPRGHRSTSTAVPLLYCHISRVWSSCQWIHVCLTVSCVPSTQKTWTNTPIHYIYTTKITCKKVYAIRTLVFNLKLQISWINTSTNKNIKKLTYYQLSESWMKTNSRLN